MNLARLNVVAVLYGFESKCIAKLIEVIHKVHVANTPCYQVSRVNRHLAQDTTRLLFHAIAR